MFDGQQSHVQYLVGQNLINIIQDMVSNRSLDGHFKYTLTQIYPKKDKSECVYSKMWSGDWWWEEQEKLMDKGAVTIAPRIIATDQTILSIMCGGQAAYPVYLTLGNISKHWRHKSSKCAVVLLGYLPVEAFKDIGNDQEHWGLKAKLVHWLMEKLLEPLQQVLEEGLRCGAQTAGFVTST
ncbi:hypothetical protein FRC08_004454 [Ceratobasidium sp. 394]|nr:hypothetical protein FRC08_004454 [Ceratobasidium sp. 394]